MCGAETGNAYGYDHVLVRTRLKVHLSFAPNIPRARHLNVSKIRQPGPAEALDREIRSCFTARTDGEGSNEWSSLKALVYGPAEKILGFTQRRHSDWISGRTLQLSAQTARARYQQPTAVCFVDFAVTFDSVHRESLWRIMALDGLSSEILSMIKAYYSSTTARVMVHNNLSQAFDIRSGVRQGCILSPILFNYAIGWILEKALREEDGVELAPGRRLADLDYADDIALLASNLGDLQSMVSREKAPLKVGGCQLEEVDSFKYLGARLLPNGQSKDGIVSRIDTARRVFSSLRKCLWTRRDISIDTKIRIYRYPSGPAYPAYPPAAAPPPPTAAGGFGGPPAYPMPPGGYPSNSGGGQPPPAMYAPQHPTGQPAAYYAPQAVPGSSGYVPMAAGATGAAMGAYGAQQQQPYYVDKKGKPYTIVWPLVLPGVIWPERCLAASGDLSGVAGVAAGAVGVLSARSAGRTEVSPAFSSA
ncbi:unnamed protein product [Schistocephalus solidus]|uniref:Reverse transcriptase domain-containing protein n=1 Tax=Schistocephalus solidus TaxID=70667 RepID=A0A183T5B8_SCHSO|nr:unnamed protein product [Schistocephalus solidus]